VINKEQIMMTKRFKKELDRRVKRHKQGKSKSFTIAEVKKYAISKANK
jgi:hypothetical protein